MPLAIDDGEDETLDLTEQMEAGDQSDPDGEDDDGDSDGERDDPDAGDDDGEQETVISFGDDAPADDADRPGDSSTIRSLRKELRDAKRRTAELERSTAKPKTELPPKPTLAGCGFDEEEYETKLDAWKADEAAARAGEAEETKRAEAVQADWNRDVASYEAAKTTLGVEDFTDAEDAVKGTLNLVQQAAIVKSASDPAAFIYALGNSETKLAELAKYQDPIKMAAAVARMEGAIKVVKRRKGPAIDKPANGSGQLPQGDKAKRMEALEREAERTGDRTQLIAAKKARDAKK